MKIKSYINLYILLFSLIGSSILAQDTPIVATLTDTITIPEVMLQGDTLTGTWYGTDKYEIEENILILGSNGWYSLAEQDIALKEDSLGYDIELGWYQVKDNGDLHMYPLAGKRIYQDYTLPVLEFGTNKMILKDYEHGNAGQYHRTGPPKFSKAQIDFLNGIHRRLPLLNTYWKDENKGEEWYFLAPDYLMFKKEGLYEGHARFYFENRTLVVLSPETGQVYFKAKFMTQSDKHLILNKEEGETMVFKSIGENGLTAKETIIYKNYLKRVHRMEVEEANEIKGKMKSFEYKKF